MCQICLANRPFDDGCIYQETKPDLNPGFGETWAEWFEAPNFAHTFTDRGFMTPNSTFDGAIGAFGDSDWIRIDFTKGTTYTIQMYSFSMETFLALADNTGLVLTNADYQTTVVNGFTYFYSTLEVTATRTGTYYVIAEESGHNGIGAYTVGVVEEHGSGPLQDWTLDEIANRLTDTGWEFFGGDRRSWAQDDITYNASAFNANYRPLLEHAFDAWEKVTGLKFTEVKGAADITFDDQDDDRAYANSEVDKAGSITTANINVGKNWETTNFTFDTHLFQTLIHEIGHAIGLAHAGDYNAGQGGPTSYPDSVLYKNDSWNTTIMSYINQNMNTDDNADFARVMTPMIADIIAVQDLYGVPVQAYHGNTVYGLNSNTGDYMDDVFALLTKSDTSSKFIAGGSPISFTIWDTGGSDLLNFKTDKTDQVIDLRAEALSTIYGVKGAMVMGRDTIIEKVKAGKGSDIVIGNAGANVFSGGKGADTLKGANGNDKLDGGKSKDTLLGGNGRDVLKGGAGKDKMSGQKGNDKLTGGSEGDWFIFKTKNEGRDKITDFEDNIDTLKLSQSMWSGTKTAAEVIQDFGSDTAKGSVLDFGGGNMIVIDGIQLSALQDDISV